MPNDARRNCHRVTAGKAAGTSLMPGRSRNTVPITARYAAPANINPFHEPYIRVRRCPKSHAPKVDATEIASMRKYSAVRYLMVSGSPTDGGFAGYLSAGTTYTEMSPSRASSAEVGPGPN